MHGYFSFTEEAACAHVEPIDATHERARLAQRRKTIRQTWVAQRLLEQLHDLRPAQRAAKNALVGLLTSEFRFARPSRRNSLENKEILTMAFQKGLLIALGYSGGDRPGIAPGSLYVGVSA